MDYFENAPELISLYEDISLFEEIKKYNYLLVEKFEVPKGVDGFFFVDENNYLVMIDKNHMVSASYQNKNSFFELGSGFYKFQYESKVFFLKKKFIIKNNQKYILICSFELAKILNKIDKFYKFKVF